VESIAGKRVGPKHDGIGSESDASASSGRGPYTMELRGGFAALKALPIMETIAPYIDAKPF